MDGVSVSAVGQWSTLITAIGGAIILIARAWSKMRVANKGDLKHFEIQNQLLENLRDEIKRLEAIIAALNTRIGTLENNINSLRNLEIDGSADFGALEMIMDSIPCLTCLNQGIAYTQLKSVVARMSQRRVERKKLIDKVQGDN